MIILSAPKKSGYRSECETAGQARLEAAEILGVDLADMIEVVSPDGGTTYCYASQEDADEDLDGAYAVQYGEARREAEAAAGRRA